MGARNTECISSGWDGLSKSRVAGSGGGSIGRYNGERLYMPVSASIFFQIGLKPISGF